MPGQDTVFSRYADTPGARFASHAATPTAASQQSEMSFRREAAIISRHIDAAAMIATYCRRYH